MLSFTFVICWFFYQKLRGMDHRGNFEHLWAGIYSTVIFLTLLSSPSANSFYYFGRGSGSIATRSANAATYIDLPFFSCLLVSVALGFLFYYTVRLPGLMMGGRMMGLLIAIPGMIINGIVAAILITLLT